jgi:hypothetical protein
MHLQQLETKIRLCPAQWQQENMGWKLNSEL